MRLIVAEKPSVGRDIAGALGGGRKGKGSVSGDGWTVTWAVGVDVERGYYVFGASGALVFAAITGMAMLLILRGRTR